MNRNAWALLALRETEGHRLSPVKMQKTLFLVAQNLAQEVGPEFYHFEAYHFGPFDSAVYRDLDELVNAGLVKKVRAAEHAGKDYELTELGKRIADRYARAANEKVVRYLKAVVEWVKPLSFSALVSAIYKKYPQYKQNSVFRG